MSPEVSRPVGLLHEALTHDVIGCFYRVHRELGFGYRERLYSLALERELMESGHRVARETAVMVYYRGRPLAWQRLDMIVDGKVVIEIKASALLPADATAQLFSYLCATDLEVGLLLHFGRDPRFYRVISENRLRTPGS